MTEITPYIAWSFCEHIDCPTMVRPESMRKELCKGCRAYQMHDYLQERSQVVDEAMVQKVNGMERVNALQSELIAVSERINVLGASIEEAEAMDFAPEEWHEEFDELLIRGKAIREAIAREGGELGEHETRCSTCGQIFDMRDLDQVLAHEHTGLNLATGIVGKRMKDGK